MFSEPAHALVEPGHGTAAILHDKPAIRTATASPFSRSDASTILNPARFGSIAVIWIAAWGHVLMSPPLIA
jgi:hypothetical protein